MNKKILPSLILALIIFSGCTDVKINEEIELVDGFIEAAQEDLDSAYAEYFVEDYEDEVDFLVDIEDFIPYHNRAFVELIGKNFDIYGDFFLGKEASDVVPAYISWKAIKDEKKLTDFARLDDHIFTEEILPAMEKAQKKKQSKDELVSFFQNAEVSEAEFLSSEYSLNAGRLRINVSLIYKDGTQGEQLLDYFYDRSKKEWWLRLNH